MLRSGFRSVVRARVLERISQARAFPVALIVAPAGYGKSVALRQHLETLTEPYVRFDMGPEHDTLAGFLRGLATALHDVAPHMFGTLADALRGGGEGSELAGWLSAHLQDFRGVIAIDDLQHARDPEVFAFLQSAITRLKGRVSWLIASRTAPDLPVASWMTYGDMDLAVDERDLAFTLEEVRDASDGTGAGDEELERFVAMTGGWATALSFAMRSRVRTSELAAIGSETREMVYGYLAEQVYAQLTESEREMLHVAAYLPVIDLEMLIAAGFPDAFAMLEKLRKRVAFLSVESGRTYRCHDLFRDFLQHQVQLLGADVTRDLQIRVARVLQERGDPISALRVYVGLGAESAILPFLQQHGFEFLDKGHGEAVDAAINALSDEARNTNAAIIALRAVRESDLGRLDRAEALFEKAVASAVDDVLRAEIAIRLASMLFAQMRDVTCVLEPLLREDLPESVYAKAISLLASAYAYAGRVGDAVSAISLTQKHVPKIESDDLRAKIFHRIGLASLVLGLPYEQICGFFEEAEALATARGIYYTAAAALTGLATATLLYEQNASKYASYAPRIIAHAAKAGDRYTMLNALLLAIDCESRLGNFDRMLEYERQFAAVGTTDHVRARYVNAMQGMRKAWQGKFEEAYRIAASDTCYYNFDLVLSKATRALYALAANLRSSALELVQETLTQIEEDRFDYPYGRSAADIAWLLCALVEALAGRATIARRILRRASLDGNDAVQALRALVTAIVGTSEGGAAAYDRSELLRNFAGTGHGGLAKVLESLLDVLLPERGERVVLTDAELAVLRALNDGWAPKQIAADTGRSVHTVRTLIQRATERLGCSGRQQALAVARNYGWLTAKAGGGSSDLA